MNWLSVASNVISLLASLAQFINAQRERNVGWTEAVNYGLELSAKQIAAAADEMNRAEEIHMKDPSDNAFDPQFKRPD